ncbi:hypothetical protein SAMN04488540_105198 [Ferrimonas sediminum]|uniref:Uncharacterized protein n=1 Tax=Ferrimonas sediminum TaxID=718193 RepID=A0A1G8RLE7_9GAMM|nr:hypothetical protein [Ferrimonas sediminum]SDJ17200.1 hypothetical protein SAMN04488540_105198 [Ferrimonas sediminum]
MFKKSMIAATVLSLVSISSLVSAQEVLDLSVVSSGAGALVKVTRENQPVVGAVVTANSNKVEGVTDRNGQVYISIRDVEAKPVLFNVTDDEGNSATATQFITKNHR